MTRKKSMDIDIKKGGIRTTGNKLLLRTIFNELNIAPNWAGYPYLWEAVFLEIENPIYSNSVMRDIYGNIAKTYNVSVSSVERSMRYAIGEGFSQMSKDTRVKYFRSNVGPNIPVSEFIASVALYFSIKMEKIAITTAN